jgi:DNA polymerase/3'-5' exonuclease PolX
MRSGPRHRAEDVIPIVIDLLAKLEHMAIVCGSLSRRLETVGDIDLVLDGISLDDAIDRLGLPVISRGDPRSEVMGPQNIIIDLWSVSSDLMGPMVFHATGSGMHNTVMRRWAREVHGLSVTWRGVHTNDNIRVDDGTEDGIRNLIGWPLLKPWERDVKPFSRPEWLEPYLQHLNSK